MGTRALGDGWLLVTNVTPGLGPPHLAYWHHAMVGAPLHISFVRLRVLRVFVVYPLGREIPAAYARCPGQARLASPRLQELAQVQRQRQLLAERGIVQLAPEQVLQALHAIEHGVPVKIECGGRFLD